jgi:hypothetical protein
MDEQYVYFDEYGEVNVSDLTKEQILSEELLSCVFDEEDVLNREMLITAIGMKAKEYKIKREFDNLIRACKKAVRSDGGENVTVFPVPEDDEIKNLRCGSWITKSTGEIETLAYGLGNKITACLHPIIPVKRLINTETGEEQIVLAFFRNHHWRKLVVAKEVISSATKITSLSKSSVQVTSENAKALVRYLSEVEHLNEDDIKIFRSSSKLGWHDNDVFLPYDKEIQFDAEDSFREIYHAIGAKGDRETWLEHMRKLRMSKNIEVKLSIAASLASPLVEKLDALPFIVDFYGETGHGKTVLLKVATSCWADPAESKYIGSFRATPTSLEVRADMLNSLPMILDDTSNANPRIKEDYESTVYSLCAGKGRSRSNVNLGANNEKRWSNCTLTNGEKPLSSYTDQGGGINRIIECRCKGEIFEDPKGTVAVVEENFGFAGREMIEAIKSMTAKDLRERFDYFAKKLNDHKRTAKQIMALAVILVADEIATESIFQDGMYISVEDAAKLLVTTEELSDNFRCYRYICDKARMNPLRFESEDSELIFNGERWGTFMFDGDEKYAVFFPTALDELCKTGGFSKKSFVTWAVERDYIMPSAKGDNSRVVKVNGQSRRGYWIKMNGPEDREQVSAASWKNLNLSSVSEEIPFDFTQLQ